MELSAVSGDGDTRDLYKTGSSLRLDGVDLSEPTPDEGALYRDRAMAK